VAAVAVIAGLLFPTLLTLFVSPYWKSLGFERYFEMQAGNFIALAGYYVVICAIFAFGAHLLRRGPRKKSRYLTLIRSVWRHLLVKVLACPKGCGTQGEAVLGEIIMARVLNEDVLSSLSPSVRPCPLALADRDRRAELEHRDLTAAFFGDPLPGMSALDRRRPQ